jgi:hypothetical protein
MSSPWATADSLELAATSDDEPLLIALWVVLSSVPGCHAAGVALVRDGFPLTVAASHLPIRWLTEIQYEQATGPCWEAMATDRPVVVNGIRGGRLEEGWRVVAQACGLSAALAVPLATADGSAAVLQLWTRDRTGWPATAVSTATTLAGYLSGRLPGAWVSSPPT